MRQPKATYSLGYLSAAAFARVRHPAEHGADRRAHAAWERASQRRSVLAWGMCSQLRLRLCGIQLCTTPTGARMPHGTAPAPDLALMFKGQTLAVAGSQCACFPSRTGRLQYVSLTFAFSTGPQSTFLSWIACPSLAVLHRFRKFFNPLSLSTQNGHAHRQAPTVRKRS